MRSHITFLLSTAMITAALGTPVHADELDDLRAMMQEMETRHRLEMQALKNQVNELTAAREQKPELAYIEKDETIIERVTVLEEDLQDIQDERFAQDIESNRLKFRFTPRSNMKASKILIRRSMQEISNCSQRRS